MEQFVRQLAAELGQRVRLEVYDLTKDPVGASKYGPLECRTVVLNEQTRLESPSRSQLRQAVLGLLGE